MGQHISKRKRRSNSKKVNPFHSTNNIVLEELKTMEKIVHEIKEETQAYKLCKKIVPNNNYTQNPS